MHFRYSLGSSPEVDLALSYVNVSDGDWHTVSANRLGQWCSLQLDFRDGLYVNESFSSPAGGHLEFHVAQHGLVAGGDVRFPSTSSSPTVAHDFSDGNCVHIDLLFSQMKVERTTINRDK